LVNLLQRRLGSFVAGRSPWTGLARGPGLVRILSGPVDFAGLISAGLIWIDVGPGISQAESA
jgi:hypothetical protein